MWIANLIFFSCHKIATIPDYNHCKEAAKACLQLSDTCGDLGNFRLCASFNCPPNIPFFPAAYHEERTSSIDKSSIEGGEHTDKGDVKPQVTLTVGLESGDLLFLAFHGVTGPSEDSSNSHISNNNSNIF